ncbi:MAG: YceI family protein [Chromatiaceae bacterium]|nr:YceI family protein [Gammaproteobacteria bacterium]MCP5312171.1 YceI family protein [Chromatiaceae bacterium]
MVNRQIVFAGVAGLAMVAVTASAADWTLMPEESHVVYTTTKVFPENKSSAAENNRFTSLTGSVSDAGEAEVRIALASVATNVPIRDERMRTIVFDTEKFPEATVQAQVPPVVLSKEGTHQIDLSMTLALRDATKQLTVPVVVYNERGRAVVTALQPVLISAGDFGLDTGVAELTKIAGLGYIPATVPVWFHLVFRRD